MAYRKYGNAEVLGYDFAGRFCRETVKRYYRDWREENQLPERCDIDGCPLNIGPLDWNGQKLGLHLDHIDGNAKNNKPRNLRLVCPNCHSQQKTTGGRNVNRIQNESESGYDAVERDGTKATTRVLKSDAIEMGDGQVKAVISDNDNSGSD